MREVGPVTPPLQGGLLVRLTQAWRRDGCRDGTGVEGGETCVRDGTCVEGRETDVS